jgi:hypothetical protein
MKKADHHLIQQVLDGDVSREDFDGFQQRLREDPKLVELYEDYAILHHSLNEEYEDRESLPVETPAPRSRAFSVPWAIGIAAALTLLAVGFAFRPWFGQEADQDVALVTFSADAVWKIEGLARPVGAATSLAAGNRLRLGQGRASIALEPSMIAVIEGPADLTLPSKAALHLASGRGFFQLGGGNGGLTLTTPRLTAVDFGTEFGIEVSHDGPDELLVSTGRVEVSSKSGDGTTVLVAGDAARIPAKGKIERFPADERPFAKSLGRFHPVVSGPFEITQWRIEHGSPEIMAQRIDGMNYSAFLEIPETEGRNSGVVLATLDAGKPSRGGFHTDGWAGMSLFSDGREVLFFGDSFGTKPTWSLDVKQGNPVILPEQPVVGPRAVTLRYDPRNGDVTLHDGGQPLKPPFCSGKIPAGLHFDEVRIGASSGAGFTVKSLDIRVGSE